jgi:hypothetical protein
LLTPSRAVFELNAAHANLGRAIIFAAGIGMIAGVIGSTINLFSADGSLGDIVVRAMFYAMGFVAALLVTQVVIHGMARATGGPGAFESQVYLASLYAVPLNFVAIFGLALNNFWSGLGFVIAFAVVLYQVVLTVPMLRAVHGVEWRVSHWLVILIAVVGNLVGGGIGAILPQ